ncbi:outer membrane protein assembly factor BamB [Archangium gephyra]|uniref:Glycoprotein gp2 n=1 Tax=Archangium gephyra TaxID=48 RepID=A0AAC8QA77_9BACT|nr:PQQ-binding-like beta-propeller repeat protein [Archangium gephyra]AKJ03716.1 Glycoprotein gp2 [Archangium gephyra]REG22505.1 outer membrane protein assembly factor BamB [Archangium gephyra]
MNARLFALLTLLLPAAALAQNAWTVTPVEGSAVMGEISSLVFEVRNASTSTRPLNELSLAVDGAAYDVDGGDAPAGWTVSTIDRKERRITYRATGSCTPGPLGLAPGASARFTLRLVGLAANADTTDALVGGNNPTKSSMALDTCPGGVTFTGDPALARWKRVGLSATLTALPRTLQLGSDVTVQLLVVNRSLVNQGGITPSGPAVVGSARFDTVVSAFSPASLSLAPGATGSFTARLRSTLEGTSVFQASAGNGTVSTALTSSLQVNVSSFPALAEVLPTNIITGDTVTLRLTVSNPSTVNYRDVVPRTPVFLGTAVPTLVSGPTPAKSTTLNAGTSVSFVWKYKLDGPVGSSFQFEAQADATRAGVPLSTSRVLSGLGRIVEHRLFIEPASVIGGVTNRSLRYVVYNGGTVEIRKVKLLTPDTTFFKASATPFASDTSGWTAVATTSNPRGYEWTVPAGQSGITSGQQRGFTLDYATLGAVTRDTAFLHQMELTLADGSTVFRVDAPVTLFVNRVVPEVESLVAIAGQNRNTLVWTNPSDHDGVLVLRAVGAAPNTAPEPGRRYVAGETLGNAKVVYSDEVSVASTLEDSGLSNGTAYVYRVHNHDTLYRYSPGNAPQSLGLKSTPTSRGAGQPLWCYSVGFSTLQQPVTELGVGIFSSNTSGRVTANLTNTATPVLDGNERWRPVQLQGAVQSRFPIVPLSGRSGQYILTGDQAGYTQAIRTDTGELLWRSTTPLGTIQSFPVAQLHDTTATNAAYKAAFPGKDLAFFATRLSTGTDNKVVALDAATGAPVWTYAPGDLGMVSGGLLIDYTYNRLYVGARSNGGALASLRILDSLTGAELARLSLGDIDHGLVRYGSATPLALVTNSDGTVYGVDMVGMKVSWSAAVASRPSASVPAFSQFARPVNGGFVVSILGATDAEGRVERWSVTTSTSGTTVTKLWSTPIPSPSGSFSFTSGGVQRLYVGGKDEKLHELDINTGVDGKQLSLPGALAIGTPTVDSTVSRLHVGTQDGRICAFPVPFP